MTPERLANLRSRVERAEDGAKHLDGNIGRMWAERYAGDVAFLLGHLTQAGPGSDRTYPSVCTHPAIKHDGTCASCGYKGWLPVAVLRSPFDGATPPQVGHRGPPGDGVIVDCPKCLDQDRSWIKCDCECHNRAPLPPGSAAPCTCPPGSPADIVSVACPRHGEFMVESTAPPGSAVAGVPAMPTQTTYARSMAHKAQDKWLNGPGGHYAALVAVEEVVAEVGERCAVESEVGVCQFNDEGARCAHSVCAAKRVIARRIRTLFAPAAPPDSAAGPRRETCTCPHPPSGHVKEGCITQVTKTGRLCSCLSPTGRAAPDRIAEPTKP